MDVTSGGYSTSNLALNQFSKLFIAPKRKFQRDSREEISDDSNEDVIVLESLSSKEEQQKDQTLGFRPGYTYAHKTKDEIAKERNNALGVSEICNKRLSEVENELFALQQSFEGLKRKYTMVLRHTTQEQLAKSMTNYIIQESLKLLETDSYPTQDQPQIKVLADELYLLSEEGRETGFLHIEKRLDFPNQDGDDMHAVMIEVEKMENNERRMITVELYHDNDEMILSTVQFQTNYDEQNNKYTYKEGTAFFNTDEARQNIEHFFSHQPVQ